MQDSLPCPLRTKNLSTVCSNLKVFLFFFLEYCRGADGKSGNNYNNKKAGHGREEWVVFLFCFMVYSSKLVNLDPVDQKAG